MSTSPRHTAYLAAQIAARQEYLDHADNRSRIHGLQMLRGDIDFLLTKEAMAQQRRPDAPTQQAGHIRRLL